MNRYHFVALLSLLLAITDAPARASGADTFYADVNAKRYAQAVAAGAPYLAAHPKEDAFAIDLAYAYLKLDRRNEARAIMATRNAYVEKHRKTADVWLSLSYQDSAAGDYRNAIADVDRYLRFMPDDAQAWRQRGYAVAALKPRATASSAPDESASFYRLVSEGKPADAISFGERYLSAHPDNAAFGVDLAYAYLQTKNLDAAAALAQRFNTFVTSDPNGSKLLAALFYAFQSAGDSARALAFGRTYLSLHPTDNAFAMDLAYAELKAGNADSARTILQTRQTYLGAHPDAAKLWLDISYRNADQKHYDRAIDDVDQYLLIAPSDASAHAQRAAYESGAWGGARESTFASTYWDSRLADVILSLDHVLTLAPARGIQPYLAAHLTEDTRSGNPGSPQIYSDNALIAEGGLRTPVGPYARAFVEAGAGIGLHGQGTIGDVRYGLVYSQQWNGKNLSYTSADVSAAFYSRYEGNWIAYYTAWHSFGGTQIRPMLGLNGGYDSHDIFGNRFVEGLAGLEFGNGALRMRLYGVDGVYLNAFNQQPHYSTFRAMLIYGVSH